VYIGSIIPIIKSRTTKIQAQLLQIGYQQQYNSKIATSANDGSFIPALGMQHRLTVGALFRFKNLSIQLQPEFIQAANTAPQPFNGNPFDGNYFSRYYMYYLNKIDNLSQFGTASLAKFFQVNPASVLIRTT
jgi:hypothetical protein